MLTAAASILVGVVAVPIVVLLLREAAQRRRVAANLAVAALILASAGGNVATVAGAPEWVEGSFVAGYWLAITALLACFPDGRPVPRWILVPVAFEWAVQIGNIASGFTWWDLQPWWPLHYLLAWPVLLGGQLVRFLRRSDAEDRRRVAWPLLGWIIGTWGFSLWLAAELAITGAISDTDAGSALAVVLNALFPWGFALGMLAPTIARVDRVLRAAIVLVVSTTVASLLLWDLTVLLPPAGVTGSALTWATAAALAVAVVPLLRGAQWLADRVVYRGRPDPLRMLDELGRRLESTVEPLEVPTAVVRSIRDGLGLERVELVVQDAVVGSIGEGTASVEFAVVYQGETLGRIRVAPRAGESLLSEHDRTVLEHLSRQTAPALYAARTVRELVEARSRLIVAREEERKRLRRDLHDDLAPTFAGLGLTAAAVGELSRAGDTRAASAADSLVDGIAAATRQVREIAYDLRPPVLDDQGLVAAIRDRVGWAGGPAVEIVAPTERLTLPAAVESAALRIVQEAVVNVRRHAAAEHCTVEISAAQRTLRLSVVDDGRGIAAGSRDGIGMRSIRERVAELGGEVTIEHGRPGTRVDVLLPIELVPQ